MLCTGVIGLGRQCTLPYLRAQVWRRFGIVAVEELDVATEDVE